jgi:hypothetical protein
MSQRTSSVDGQRYAIGFELRLPLDWNGCFFYQANGGGRPLDNALHQGFAVISSDAGHGAPTPFLGIDPQARLDYGYQGSGSIEDAASFSCR